MQELWRDYISFQDLDFNKINSANHIIVNQERSNTISHTATLLAENYY